MLYNLIASTDSGATILDWIDTAALAIEILANKGDSQARIEQAIQIKRGYKVMLTTDKPLYQPGQLIHIRTLSLQQPKLNSVKKQPLLLEIEDSKGNKVFKREIKTDDFGIAAADFQLADEINMGTYKIRAIMGTTTSEKSVNIEYGKPDV